MRDLLLLLNEIQTLWQDRVVLVLVLPGLEQHLDHVLNPLLDVALVQDGSESFEDEVVGFGGVLGEEGSDVSSESASDLDGVRGGSFEEEEEKLEREEFVSDRLVDELGDEGGGGEADGLGGEREGEGKEREARSVWVSLEREKLTEPWKLGLTLSFLLKALLN